MLVRFILAASLAIVTPALARDIDRTGSISLQPQVRGLGCLRSETRAMVRGLVAKIGPIQITSTCGGRHARGSQHYRGKAIDFRPRATSARGAVAALRRMPQVGGVGSYSNGIVHADVGGRVHSWHGRGSGRRYARVKHQGRYARMASYRRSVLR